NPESIADEQSWRGRSGNWGATISVQLVRNRSAPPLTAHAQERADEGENRSGEPRLDRPGGRDAADVSDALGFLRSRRRTACLRQARDSDRHDARDLYRQRGDRLLDGPVPANRRRGRPPEAV